MIYCSYCGTTNRTGSRFCNQCGRTLPGPSLLCSRCQALITEVDKFCHNCGARLTHASRHFGTLPEAQDDAPARAMEPQTDALAGGTFVASDELMDDVPPPTATPTTPLRTAGSWNMIDNWVAKQMKQGDPVDTGEADLLAADPDADPTPIPDERHRGLDEERWETSESRSERPLRRAPILKIGIKINARGRVSRKQTIGILALLLAGVVLVVWLLSGRH